MKLREIFRFELVYQLRRASTWLCAAVLLAFSFVMSGFEPNDGVFLNSPFLIAFTSVLGGGVWLLVAASVAGEAASRDVQTRMHPLTYTAPAGKAAYLGGRFLAAFVLNAVILLAQPAGMLLALLLSDPDPALVGPFRPAAYATTYGFITLPFAFAATAIQFSWAALQRRAMASYLASGAIFVVSHFVLLTVANLLGRWELVRLFDLVGFGGILFLLGDTLTPAEQNTRLVGLDPVLLANRAIWLAVAGGVLALTYARFHLAHPAEGTRRSRRGRGGEAPAPAGGAVSRSAPAVVPRVRRTFGPATRARQTLGIAWTSFRAIAGSRTGLTLVGLFALHLVVFMPQYLQFMDVPVLPRTGRILQSLVAPLTRVRDPLVIIPLLIAYCAGELFWRERDAGLGDIAEAAPVPEWVLFLGKLLGLGLVVAAWLALLAAAGMLAQLAMGHPHLDVGLYARILFGLQLPEYLLFACLVLAIHAAANQKYLGHAVAVLALGFIGFAPSLGIRHNLLVYGAGPGWSYSEMRGFGPSIGPWLWFRLYWAAWALLLAVAATLLWTRGREDGAAARLRTARRRFTGPAMHAAAVAAALVLASGAFVFHNTNVLDEHRTGADRADAAAEYERRYARYLAIPQPTLAAVKLRVEIHPERGAAEVRGTYRLVNRAGVPIDSIHVATSTEVRTGGITLDRPAAAVLSDAVLGHHVYALEQPLRPGDSVTLGFAVEYRRRGFRHDGVDASVVANGTVFSNTDWLPAIGYQPARELRDGRERRARGLAAAPRLPGSLHDVEARRYTGGAELIDFEAVVGTGEDQVAVAPGALRRAWTEGGRRYFHYSTDAPIRDDYSVFSARYAVHRAKWNDVAIEIFHHPGHTANLERMVRSIQLSLGRFTAEFGPYPWKHIRFVERPGGDGGMSADASSVAYDEGFSYLDPDPARGLDLPFYVVAHEVAHQWWGSQLSPAVVEGFWLMSESLAVYSGMQALREGYGQDQVRRYLRLVRSIYAFPRSRAAAPLLRADESFLGYRKGAVALYALSRYVGEDRVNAALRSTVEKHAEGGPPLPTSLDLYRELRAVTPDSMRYLLRDLFETNTYWELETESVRIDPAAAGEWRVTLDVRARKVVVDTAGAETEVPMDDWVEIGVFAPVGEGVEILADPVYARMHRIRSGRQTITVAVRRKPIRAGIDPYHLLIDLDTEDNLGRPGRRFDGI